MVQKERGLWEERNERGGRGKREEKEEREEGLGKRARQIRKRE